MGNKPNGCCIVGYIFTVMCHIFWAFINWFGKCIWKSDLFDMLHTKFH